VVKNDANLGFAAACNQGARLASGKYLLFLNPDTRLLPNSLQVPVGFLSRTENAAVGICGIRLLDDSGCTSRDCTRFPQLSHYVSKAVGLDRLLPGPVTSHSMKEWDHQSDREVDQVIGAFFLIRRNVFEELGGFDERFFVYFEEVDFSLRAHRAGWKTMYLAGPTAYHKGHGSSGKIPARRLFYSLRSRLLYSLKNWPAIQVVGLFVVTLLVEPLTRLCFSLAKGAVGDARGTLAAYGMLVRELPNILFRSHRSMAAKSPRPTDPNAH
jgi:GT2 family glycosyltransferase